MLSSGQLKVSTPLVTRPSADGKLKGKEKALWPLQPDRSSSYGYKSCRRWHHPTPAMTPLRCLNGISTARLFAQIAGRSFLSTAASASAPLEFLLPIRPCHSSSRPQVLTPRPVETATAVRSIPHGQRRPFIASTVRPATICVLHPQKDDDGSDKIVEITPRAASVSRPH